jgi:hypothetical protein
VLANVDDVIALLSGKSGWAGVRHKSCGGQSRTNVL